MPAYRMGEALGLRPTYLSTLIKSFTATLPRFDPNQYGLADYSFYEGLVNFQLAKSNGLKRPIIRVGQGYYGIDPQFKSSSANSKTLFSRDFYWMLDVKQSANGQAIACANALKTYGQMDDDSILFADFEIAPVDASFLWGFIATLKAQMPDIKIGIYTGYYYWNTYGSSNPKYGFDQYKLWIAWPVSPYQAPKALAPWGNNWYYHQWTFAGDGRFYGTQSLGLDLNYLNPIYVPTNPNPEPPPPAEPKQYVVIGSPYSNIRSTPEIADNKVGFALNGSQVLGTPNADNTWVELHGFISAAVLKEGTINPPSPTPTPTPAPAGAYYRILHDQEMPPYFLPRMLQPGSTNDPKVGIPETVNLENSNPVKLTKGWQLFIAALLQVNAPELTRDELDHAYRNLLGVSEAWANGTGYPQGNRGGPRADYVANTDLDSPLPLLDRSRTSGGNVVHVLDETPVSVGGTLCLKVETLKADTVPDPTLVNYYKTPWLVFNCTTVTPFKIFDATGKFTGRYRCNRFPQLTDRDVPMPLITDVGYGFIDVNRLVKVPTPFGVSPYVFS